MTAKDYENALLTLKFINPTCGDVAYAHSPSLKVTVPAGGEIIVDNLPEKDAHAIVDNIQRRCRAIQVHVLADEAEEPLKDKSEPKVSVSEKKNCNPCSLTAVQVGAYYAKAGTEAAQPAQEQVAPETAHPEQIESQNDGADEAALQTEPEAEAEPVKEKKPFSLEDFMAKCKAEKTGSKNKVVWKTVVMARKGLPFTPIRVTRENFSRMLGKPLPKKETGMEGLRHVNGCLEDCNYVNVIRVVADDARFPEVLTPKVSDSGTVDVEHNSHKYGTSLSIGDSYLFQFYPVDGQASLNRSFMITKMDEVKRRFTLAFYDLDDSGEAYLMEDRSWVAGLDKRDKDDMGAPAFIESVLEQGSEIFRVNYNEAVTWEEALPTLQALAGREIKFEGGSDGGEPKVTDWIKAWSIFRNENVAANMLFAAGNYESEVLAEIAAIADSRHNAAIADVPPSLNPSTANAFGNNND